MRAPLLFEIGPPQDDETPVERSRRLARERQRTWRQRNQQFYVPIIEAPTATYVSTGERA